VGGVKTCKAFHLVRKAAVLVASLQQLPPHRVEPLMMLMQQLPMLLPDLQQHHITSHTLTHLFIGHLLVHSFMYTFMHALICSSVSSFVHSFICSLTCSFVHSHIPTLIHSFLHACTHAFSHSLFHRFVLSFMHCLFFQSSIYSVK